MNLMLTKSNQSRLNVGWKPFATSTPLKMPNNVDVEKESLKQLQICMDSLGSRKLQKCYNSTNVAVKKPVDFKQMVTKRLRKNKSCANFDFSSSDEDSSNEKKKRPVIKLIYKKQTNLLLKNRKSGERGINLLKNSNPSDNCTKTDKYEKNNVSDVKNLKQNYDHMCNSEKEKQSNAKKLSLDNLNSKNQIFDKAIGTTNITVDIKLHSKSKENSEKYFKSSEKIKNLSNCKFKINKSENVAKNKQKIQSSVENEYQLSKNCQKTNFEDLDLHRVIRRKCKDSENTVKVARNKKTENKLSIPSKSRFENNAVATLNVLENKTNLSHQLFSDSREQELINILDLTSEEVIQGKESKASFLWQKVQKLDYNSVVLSYPSDPGKSFENQKDRPQRRHNLKKYWLTQNLPYKELPTTNAEKQTAFKSNFNFSKKSDEYVQEPQLSKKVEEIGMFLKGLTESNSEKSAVSCKKTRKTRKPKNKMLNKGERKKKSAPKSVRKSNQIESNADANNVSSSLGLSDGVSNNNELSKPFQHMGVEIKNTVEKPVFKLLNELSYNEDETGCSAAECWDINSFKCGIFKLKTKSQMACRTMHFNSHLGGVLINGKLRMKIGGKELDLNQGDMTFVPPLTEWQATNIGECESVFYYWCGRFKI